MTILRQYTITDLQEEIQALITKGRVTRQQRIYELSRHFSDRQWHNVEKILSANNFLLRDRVIELAGKESWLSD
jgi:Domain of unknown function (DUF4327)